jgi:hypothetical protein
MSESLTTSVNQKGHYFQGPSNIWYYVEISMYNQLQGQTPLYIPFFLVESFTIHETLFDWVTKAEIVFNNDFEIFLRGSPNGSSKIASPYIERTDGRNKVNIKVRPVNITLNNGVLSETSDTSVNFPKKYWEMDHDFVVVDIEDLYVGNNQRKKRRYILIDEKYQILKEKVIEWSSETIAAKKNNSTKILTSAESALNPNDVLREFLTLVSTNGGTMPQINIGFDESGSIDKPNIPLDKIYLNNWDIGYLSNVVNFYKESNQNAIDDMFYILSHCISYDGFPVILDYGRSSEDKGWQLNSLSYYFEKSTPEQVEHLIIEDGLMSDSENGTSYTPYIPRASNSDGTQVNNFTSIQASRIKSYKYSPMVSVDDNRLQNSPLNFYNEHTGYFESLKKENSIKNLANKLKELANKGLYSFKNSSFGPQILLNINKTKSTGQMTKNHFALNGPYGSRVAPLMHMILDSVFLNQSISFQCPGLTLRNPGKFIFVDRIGAGDKNTFDDRFLGPWMITSVSHLFTQETYVTEVFANKIDSFSYIWNLEDNNY